VARRPTPVRSNLDVVAACRAGTVLGVPRFRSLMSGRARSASTERTTDCWPRPERRQRSLESRDSTTGLQANPSVLISPIFQYTLLDTGKPYGGAPPIRPSRSHLPAEVQTSRSPAWKAGPGYLVDGQSLAACTAPNLNYQTAATVPSYRCRPEREHRILQVGKARNRHKRELRENNLVVYRYSAEPRLIHRSLPVLQAGWDEIRRLIRTPTCSAGRGNCDADRSSSDGDSGRFLPSPKPSFVAVAVRHRRPPIGATHRRYRGPALVCPSRQLLYLFTLTGASAGRCENVYASLPSTPTRAPAPVQLRHEQTGICSGLTTASGTW
jgi:hypothetical protein